MFPRRSDPELIHFRVTNRGDPLGVMHLKEKSAKYAQGDGKETGVSREMCSLDIQTLSKNTSG